MRKRSDILVHTLVKWGGVVVKISINSALTNMLGIDEKKNNQKSLRLLILKKPLHFNLYIATKIQRIFISSEM